MRPKARLSGAAVVGFQLHWTQGRCLRCGAWLLEMPDEFEFEHFIYDKYRESCEYCGRSPSNLSIFAVDQVACERCRIEHQVDQWRYRWHCIECGWVAETVDVRSPRYFGSDPSCLLQPPGTFPASDHWWLPRFLILAINGLAGRYTRPVASAALEGRPSLLDHDGRRAAPWGSVYEGSVEDPTRVRLALARLRHARHDTDDARMAWLASERAVLAVNNLYARHPKLLEPWWPDDPVAPRQVAPVLGSGCLDIEGRYTAWLLEHKMWPWLWDPRETWGDRLRRAWAGLPDPDVPLAAVPPSLDSLILSISIADDFDLFLAKTKSRPRQEVEGESVKRFGAFRLLSSSGTLPPDVPLYSRRVRHPPYVSADERCWFYGLMGI